MHIHTRINNKKPGPSGPVASSAGAHRFVHVSYREPFGENNIYIYIYTYIRTHTNNKNMAQPKCPWGGKRPWLPSCGNAR